MKKIGYLLLLVYVFIIPIYYYHLKEWKNDGKEFDSKDNNMAIVVSALWPIGFTMEVIISLQEGWKITHPEKKKSNNIKE